MHVPFLDLRIKSQSLRKKYTAVIDDILKSGRILLGPAVLELEKKLAKYCGRKYCVAVGSGTDAVFMAVKVLNIGSKDEVVTTPLSWVASTNAIVMNNAKPIFCHINDDLNIDVKSVEKNINKNTKAVLAVNFSGSMSDLEQLEKICRIKKVFLIEDASQSFGARIGKRKSCSFGKISAVSFNPMKILSGFGECGAVFCDDLKLYKKLISIRYNGTINRETCLYPSLNFRIDTIQAALLLKQFERLRFNISKRRKLAKIYDKNLRGLVKIPKFSLKATHSYFTYTILTAHRDNLAEYLKKFNIETKIKHKQLIPEHPAYKKFNNLNFAKDKKIVGQILCLPMHENLTTKQVNFVCEKIKNFFNYQILF
jgi:dTDP-4-amino-4,6-dideoxygalactose transaminase